MNKYITFAFVVFALIASGNCGHNYGSNSGYGNLANLALNSYDNSGSSSSAASSSAASAAAPANVYSAPAYTAPAYTAPAYTAPAYSAPAYPAHGPAYNSYSSKSSYAAPKYSVLPAYASELYPGQQNYQAYNSAPTYSQVALPVVPSAPVAKLFVPAQKSYGSYAPNYGSVY